MSTKLIVNERLLIVITKLLGFLERSNKNLEETNKLTKLRTELSKIKNDTDQNALNHALSAFLQKIAGKVEKAFNCQLNLSYILSNLNVNAEKFEAILNDSLKHVEEIIATVHKQSYAKLTRTYEQDFLVSNFDVHEKKLNFLQQHCNLLKYIFQAWPKIQDNIFSDSDVTIDKEKEMFANIVKVLNAYIDFKEDYNQKLRGQKKSDPDKQFILDSEKIFNKIGGEIKNCIDDLLISINNSKLKPPYWEYIKESEGIVVSGNNLFDAREKLKACGCHIAELFSCHLAFEIDKVKYIVDNDKTFDSRVKELYKEIAQRKSVANNSNSASANSFVTWKSNKGSATNNRTATRTHFLSKQRDHDKTEECCNNNNEYSK